jgi:Nbl1 / Borealin N terminal
MRELSAGVRASQGATRAMWRAGREPAWWPAATPFVAPASLTTEQLRDALRASMAMVEPRAGHRRSREGARRRALPPKEETKRAPPTKEEAILLPGELVASRGDDSDNEVHNEAENDGENCGENSDGDSEQDVEGFAASDHDEDIDSDQVGNIDAAQRAATDKEPSFQTHLAQPRVPTRSTRLTSKHKDSFPSVKEADLLVPEQPTEKRVDLEAQPRRGRTEKLNQEPAPVSNDGNPSSISVEDAASRSSLLRELSSAVRTSQGTSRVVWRSSRAPTWWPVDIPFQSASSLATDQILAALSNYRIANMKSVLEQERTAPSQTAELNTCFVIADQTMDSAMTDRANGESPRTTVDKAAGRIDEDVKVGLLSSIHGDASVELTPKKSASPLTGKVGKNSESPKHANDVASPSSTRPSREEDQDRNEVQGDTCAFEANSQGSPDIVSGCPKGSAQSAMPPPSNIAAPCRPEKDNTDDPDADLEQSIRAAIAELELSVAQRKHRLKALLRLKCEDVRATVQLTLQKLPKRVREMPVKDYIFEYGGDVHNFMMRAIEERVFAQLDTSKQITPKASSRDPLSCAAVEATENNEGSLEAAAAMVATTARRRAAPVARAPPYALRRSARTRAGVGAAPASTARAARGAQSALFASTRGIVKATPARAARGNERILLFSADGSPLSPGAAGNVVLGATPGSGDEANEDVLRERLAAAEAEIARARKVEKLIRKRLAEAKRKGGRLPA